MKIKKDIYFIIFFALFVCLVFWDILILKTGFLKGDYLQQFLPWYRLYAGSLKEFHLPLWIRHIQCGFPLFAEGQIGALYPFNLLFFFFLPFKLAYNYSFLFHFILTGIFTYHLSRKLGADTWGGALSAILLCFGSVYAGCFVNISALKSLTWFPLTLLIYENYLERKEKHLLLWIGLLMGMQLLAGSFQMTFYSIVFSLIYFLCRSMQKNNTISLFFKECIFILPTALLISLPQVLATYQLSQYSNRASGSLGFALWNSLSPAALIGSLLPYLGVIFSKGNIIYIGTVGLFFGLVSMWSLRQDKKIRPLLLLLGVSLLLALGKFNPIYVLLITVFIFYSFRAPSRFIYFTVFALSVLSGIGFTYFFNKKAKVPAGLYRIFMLTTTAAIAVFLTIKLAFMLFGPNILAIAKNYTAKHIYGKPFHRYSLDSYLARVEGFYNQIIERLSFQNFYVILMILAISGAMLLVYFSRRMKAKNILSKYACFIFICAELFAFSFYSKGIWPDLGRFGYHKPKNGKIFTTIQTDSHIFRICPFGNWQKLPPWIRPNTNAIYNIDSAAAYSPLVNRDYFLLTKDLGIVDDSLGIVPSEEKLLYQNLNLLKELNVEYIISHDVLSGSLLDLVAEENGIYLYRVNSFLPRFFIYENIGRVIKKKEKIVVKKYESGFAKIAIGPKKHGFLVFLERFYPGWQAYIDGEEADIIIFAEMFQAVKIAAGRQTITFKYEPLYLKILIPISLAAFISVLLYGLIQHKKKAI